MKKLMLALIFSPFFAHADSSAGVDKGMSMAQYEFNNTISYAHESTDPEDQKYAVCAGKSLQFDGAVPETNDSGYQYYRYTYSADCGSGVVFKYTVEFYPSLNCELRGE